MKTFADAPAEIHAKARETSVEATVIRADGRIERLGVISYWHANPLRRWAFACRRWLKGFVK
jgi:hypothetical protein